MHLSRDRWWAAVASVSVVPLLLVAAPAWGAAVAPKDYDLRLRFDSGETLAVGSAVTDTSGNGRDGIVRSSDGGAIMPVQGYRGTVSARYPSPCEDAVCPKSTIEVKDAARLDPYSAEFEWGARILLDPTSTSHGENVLQKGLYTTSGGQWKLQVDGLEGEPSCLVSGYHSDGSFERVVVQADRTVATSTWHSVVCRRTTTEVLVLVDGSIRGRAPMQIVRVVSSAPVTVGSKAVGRQDNDQFFGELDEVYVRHI